MLRFRQMKSLQKFASVHASLHNHFSQERRLVDIKTYMERRSAAWIDWHPPLPDALPLKGSLRQVESGSQGNDITFPPVP